MTRQENEVLRTEFIEEIKARLIGPVRAYEELREKPNKRYLTGMVFPRGSSAGSATSDEEELPDDASASDDQEGLESPMDLLFQKLPASVGITFALANNEKTIRIELGGARYERRASEVVAEEDCTIKESWNSDECNAPIESKRSGKAPLVWKHIPLVEIDKDELIEMPAESDGNQKRSVFGGRASVHLHIRRSQGARIATVSLVNERETGEGSPLSTEDILFQVRMTCRPGVCIPAYPDPSSISEDNEAEELALQYLSLPTFAVGHGCGVAWPEPVDNAVDWVSVDFMPAVEVPPVTTDIDSLPMDLKEALTLSKLQDKSYDPIPAFRKFVSAYREWRDRLATEKVPPRFKQPRKRVLDRIDATILRMEDGIALLANPQVMTIFKQSNRAMLLSIARTAGCKDRDFVEPFSDICIETLDPTKFGWRPFQLAFILLSLRGLWETSHPDRSIVDLIWFPTGGGKTEAYLAVAAFEMIRRRTMDGNRGDGTAVIKRYTLRLLTIQQFERAGSLICALETMRKSGELPGDTPFTLGLWVGKDSSPNDYKSALADLKKILGTIGKVDGVKVPLKRCPVCATPIVPSPKDMGDEVVGIRESSGKVHLFCPDPNCPFHESLPISYIDDYLYEHPPTMLIGTIDKFAMLAWRDEARCFFGDGESSHPPSLIIQDELHLISGPLGTLAGVYEAAIDTAITSLGIPAKYICATATIRRADDQIRKLYGRTAALFPPPGLDAADSFFSKAKSEESGRLYFGTMGQGHTPTFSNVITSAALLAAGGAMRTKFGDIADTWWTLVAYHNSKRELGKTLSLARDDIPARLRALAESRTISGAGVKELSANLKDSEIPEALDQLKVALPDKGTLDYVACTNMLSVGVDIQRLGLMLVNGQPKTVSEYIQASSRVGRDNKRPPGIVCALFSPTKPRDRSHYEFFRAFHKGYYRHVEPTSVTPFALPSQYRGLHGAFLALVRMVSSVHDNRHASRITKNISEITKLAEDFLKRVELAKDGDIAESRECLGRFIDLWTDLANRKGSNLRFQSKGNEHAALIRPYKSLGNNGIETLQSLRNVDTPLKLVVPMIQTNSGTVTP